MSPYEELRQAVLRYKEAIENTRYEPYPFSIYQDRKEELEQRKNLFDLATKPRKLND